MIDTEIFDNSPISFADKRIQNEFRRLKKKKDIERRNFIANGGKIFTERTNSRPLTSTFKTRKLAEVTKRGFCLPTLSQLNLVIEKHLSNYYYAYAIHEKIGMLSDEEKSKRGAHKNRNWAQKSFLSVLCEDFAKIQNEVLSKNGFSIRVDHRTLKAQKEEAEPKDEVQLLMLCCDFFLYLQKIVCIIIYTNYFTLPFSSHLTINSGSWNIF